MADRFERLYRAYVRLLTWLGILCGLITFAIMWLIDANALMRRFFNAPVPGAFELTEASLVLIVFLSLAYTQTRRGHIRVTLLTRHLPIRLQHGLYIAVLFIGAIFFAWCAYAAFGYAMRSYSIGEEEWGQIRFPIWPVKMAIFVGTALLSAQFLFDVVRHCFVARGDLSPIGEDP